ncbi:DUF805 domain-containing protein [Kribbella sp. NPDC056951]|uniref:DUF805 domain-containing protein n=1 Tax=Kribbella sp. NPDC056951 TaxID=3345978 RepID=UPI00363F992A
MSVVRAVFDPRGRGLRREYWLVWLAGWVVLLAPILVDRALGLSAEQRVGWAIGGLGLVAHQVVAVLAAIRRLHDTDHSGWWLLMSFVPVVGSAVLFVHLTSAGTPGLNRYGADPHPGVPPAEQVYPVKQPKSPRAKVIDGFWWLAFAVVFSLLIVALVNQ